MELLIKWKGYLPSENTWIRMNTEEYDIRTEIENTQLLRMKKGIEIEEIIGEYNEEYVLVKWNDQTTSYVTMNFIKEFYALEMIK